MGLGELILAGTLLALQIFVVRRCEYVYEEHTKKVCAVFRAIVDAKKHASLALKAARVSTERCKGAEMLAKMSEKMAERAFSMASSATVGLGILQKTLQTRPRILTKEQLERNEVAKKRLNDMFGTEEIEFLKPILTDEEIEIYENAVEHNLKHGDRK